MNTLKYSVLMSCYREPLKFVKEAIHSILNQMDGQDGEFIIFLDDPTNYVLRDYLQDLAAADSRVVFVPNKHNCGLAHCLNMGIHIAKGQYIVRMDADDIACPMRLKKEISYLDKHPEVSVVGTAIECFDESTLAEGTGVKQFFHQNDDEYRAIDMCFFNAGIAHPTAVLRKKFLGDHRIYYDEKMTRSEDYALWSTIIHFGGVIRTINEVLLRRRMHAGQVSTQFNAVQSQQSVEIARKNLVRINPRISEQTVQVLQSLGTMRDAYDISTYRIGIHDILEANCQSRAFSQDKLRNELLLLWIKSCFRSGNRSRKLLSSLTLSLIRPSGVIHAIKWFAWRYKVSH